MAREKPLLLKLVGWVLYSACILIKIALEISTPKSTYSLLALRARYDRGEISGAKYFAKRAEILGD